MILFIMLFSLDLIAWDAKVESFFKQNWDLAPHALKSLKNKKVLVDAFVNTKGKDQVFRIKSASFHPKKCSYILPTLSRFENYKQWLGFVKKSNYNEKNRLLTVEADHTLLPFPMVVHVLIDRPTKEGKYDFVFPTGIFPGLKGSFEIKQLGSQCNLFVQSYWKGKDTKIPDFVIELFSETLTKIGVETVIRKTR